MVSSVKVWYCVHACQHKYTMYFKSHKWLPAQKSQHARLNVLTSVKSYLSADGMFGSWAGQSGKKKGAQYESCQQLKDKEGVFWGRGGGVVEFGKSKERRFKKEDAPV